MNVYEKIQLLKEDLLNSDIKKSGFNKHLNYQYYELVDIIPAIIQLCKIHRLFTSISFAQDLAILTIVNIDEPKEYITLSSPFFNDEHKSRSPVQNLGSSQTYIRRYLYMTAFDIVDVEVYDRIQGNKPPKDPVKMATTEQIKSLVALKEQTAKYNDEFSEVKNNATEENVLSLTEAIQSELMNEANKSLDGVLK